MINEKEKKFWLTISSIKAYLDNLFPRFAIIPSLRSYQYEQRVLDTFKFLFYLKMFIFFLS